MESSPFCPPIKLLPLGGQKGEDSMGRKLEQSKGQTHPKDSFQLMGLSFVGRVIERAACVSTPLWTTQRSTAVMELLLSLFCRRDFFWTTAEQEKRNSNRTLGPLT